MRRSRHALAVLTLLALLVVVALWIAARERTASDAVTAARTSDALALEPTSPPLPSVEPPLAPAARESRERVAPGAAEVAPDEAPSASSPELTLAVRDAHTRADLAHLELRAISAGYMRATWRRPGSAAPYISLGSDLTSPIGVRPRGSDPSSPNQVSGLLLRPQAGAEGDYTEFAASLVPDRAVVVFARTPTHAWGRIELDITAGGERELLLGPPAALHVRVANVDLARYAELGLEAACHVVRTDLAEYAAPVWIQPLDESIATEGLRLDALEVGAYAVSVELTAKHAWRSLIVLAREELALAAGEERQVVLTLDAPPAPRVRTTLAGTLSFPSFAREATVVLRFYDCATHSQGHAELPLAAMERIGVAPPTWSFRVHDLPAGRYQAKVWPFLHSWTIDVPPEGLEGVELALPELAEILVETVDGRSGERVPLEELRYSFEERVPDQVDHLSAAAAFDGEPGLFRCWTAPGEIRLSTSSLPPELGYGERSSKHAVEPGFQTIRFELEPVCAIRILFRDAGALLPCSDEVYSGFYEGIRAIEHDGRVTHIKLATEKLVEVTKPGWYEISFAGVGADRYLPIASERVDVRPGEIAEVIVELRRK